MRARSSESQDGRHAGSIHDPAGGDHRDVELCRQQTGQRQGGEARIVGGIEDAPMAAGLHALGDDHIDTRGLRLPAFPGRGRGRQKQGACHLQSRDPVRPRKAEVEADHRRPLLQQHGEHLVVDEEAFVGIAQIGRGLGAEPGEQGPQALYPGPIANRVGRRGRVAEQIDVERPPGERPRPAQIPPGGLGVHGAQGDGAEGSGVCDRSRQFRRGGPGHRRLDDGMVEAEPTGEGGLHGDTPDLIRR